MTEALSYLEPYAGIYEISDAARIVRATSRFPDLASYTVNNRHIIRWIRKGLALPSLSEARGRDLYISFEDLISMRIIALMRAVGIKWAKIYAAERWLRQYTGIARPFASEKLWTMGQEVFLDRKGELIAASMGGQYPFTELLERYLIPVAGLHFREGIAAEWLPLPYKWILLRPEIQFGAPCIRRTRIPTRTLWDMHEGGDSPAFIARVYRLDKEAVEEAIEWEDHLVARAA